MLQLTYEKKKSSEHYLLIWSNNTSVNSVVLTVMCAITSHGGGEDGRRPDSAARGPAEEAPAGRSASAPVSSCTGNQWVVVLLGPVVWGRESNVLVEVTLSYFSKESKIKR